MPSRGVLILRIGGKISLPRVHPLIHAIILSSAPMRWEDAMVLPGHFPLIPLPEKMAAFGISGGVGSGLKRLFMTHPPLEERIEMLKRLKV